MAQTMIHQELRAEYDEQADALYVAFSDKPYRNGHDLDDVRRIDYAMDGTVLGIEILSPRAAGVDLAGLPRRTEIAAILQKLGLPVVSGTRSN